MGVLLPSPPRAAAAQSKRLQSVLVGNDLFWKTDTLQLCELAAIPGGIYTKNVLLRIRGMVFRLVA